MWNNNNLEAWYVTRTDVVLLRRILHCRSVRVTDSSRLKTLSGSAASCWCTWNVSLPSDALSKTSFGLTRNFSITAARRPSFDTHGSVLNIVFILSIISANRGPPYKGSSREPVRLLLWPATAADVASWLTARPRKVCAPICCSKRALAVSGTLDTALWNLLGYLKSYSFRKPPLRY